MTARTGGNSHARGAAEPTPREREGGVAPTGRWPRSWPLVLGHRGSPREALENTLRSFDLAVRGGADGVELDVRPSRDGVAVVAHDDSLERVFGVRGRVSQLDWRAIERVSGARVPSFEQAVAWAAAAGAWLNVEIKAAGVEEEVVERIAAAGIAERVVISSFDPEIVALAGTLAPGLLRYFLTERWDARARARLEVAGAAGVCLRVDAATPAVLADLSARGLPVIVWTVNEPARVRELIAAGAAGIISDHPAMAARERQPRTNR